MRVFTERHGFVAARAVEISKWEFVGTTLNLYASDGLTPVRVFTLDDANNPAMRV